MSTAVVVALVGIVLLLMYLSFLVGVGRSVSERMTDDSEHPDPRTVKTRPGLRRFYGLRHRDGTGISGTGVPVEGVMFSDRYVVTHWLDQAPMHEPKTEAWHHKGVEPFEKISGHGGDTEVVWLDTL